MLLASRIADYDPQWLDHLFLVGEVVWGRLRRPRSEDRTGANIAALSRVVPISLLLREDLPWLADSERESIDGRLKGNSLRVLDQLASRGALFFQELKAVLGLLPGHLDDALRELAACGLITCDGYGAIRSFVSERRGFARHRGGMPNHRGTAAPTGRWSRFPGELGEPMAPVERLERWCWQLLRRYGVVFRDILARESSAPSWHELAPILRRMELRGEVRGGRFISGVGGEQFAGEHVVEQLRDVRAQTSASDWLVLSATDPLNLSGIVGDGPRIAAGHRNLIILREGKCVAARQAGKIEFFEEIETQTQAEMYRALQTGRRHAATHLREEWLRGLRVAKSAPARERLT
jgi:ATP-dependent Lhr-like helicase